MTQTTMERKDARDDTHVHSAGESIQSEKKVTAMWHGLRQHLMVGKKRTRIRLRPSRRRRKRANDYMAGNLSLNIPPQTRRINNRSITLP